MRLIDADVADKWMQQNNAFIDSAILKAIPTIDAVPVVRCRECKHFNLITHECENELLSTDHEGGASYSLNFYDDDFCSYGELRETSHD